MLQVSYLTHMVTGSFRSLRGNHALKKTLKALYSSPPYQKHTRIQCRETQIADSCTKYKRHHRKLRLKRGTTDSVKIFDF